MSKVLITESYLDDIADSIRAKNGTQNTYKPSQMASAIDDISGGGITPTGTISITANATGIDVSSYALADVAVPSSGITPTGTKEISITENGTTIEDVTNYASAEITVNVSGGGGSGGGTEVTVTTAKTNASACIFEIIPNAQNGHVYIGGLKSKSVSNFVTDQFIAFITYVTNGNTNAGGCLRYRGNAFASSGTASQYDAKIEVGDVFVYYDFDFSS